MNIFRIAQFNVVTLIFLLGVLAGQEVFPRVVLIPVALADAIEGEPVGPSDEAPVIRDYTANCTFKPPSRLNEMIEKAADKYHVPATMLATTIYRESGCRSGAKSPMGAVGLGQVMPNVWLPTLSKEGIASTADDLLDPQRNLYATAYILRSIMRRHDDPATIFARYNGGGAAARQYGQEQARVHARLWGRDAEG